MNINKHKKTHLINILNELSDKYLKDLSSLVDLHQFGDKKEIIESLVKNIKTPVKLRNYYYNLDDFQKEVISDILYNLDGLYIESYILAKYEKLPLFERKNILFTNNTYPSYFSLFVYQKKHIPTDLQELLKTFVPKPKIWEPTAIDLVTKGLIIPNNYNLIFYTYISSQLRILTINEKKFKITEESKKILKNSININFLSDIFRLLYHTNLIKIKNRKIIPNYKEELSLNNLIKSLEKTLTNNYKFIESIYPKKSPEFIEDIIKLRNIIIKSLAKLKINSYYKINEIYKFIEINNYNKLKTISINQAERLNDLIIFSNNLFYLGLINSFNINKDKIFYISNEQINLLSNEESDIHISINKEIIILENFEIIVIDKITHLNKLLIEQFTTQKTSKNYILNKNKLLKILNKGLKLNNFILFIKKISLKELPNSLTTYLNDLKINKILINQKLFLLKANSLIIETLVHNKKFKDNIQKLDTKSLNYNKEIEKKLISYLIQLDYYVEII